MLIAKPGTDESADPLVPFLFLGGAFGFAISAMLVPLLDASSTWPSAAPPRRTKPDRDCET